MCAMQSMQEAKEKSSFAKKLGVGCLAIFGFLFVLGVIGVALESPEDRKKREAEAAAETEKEKVAAEANSKKDAIEWYERILATAAPCDESSKTLQEQFSRFGNGTNLYTIYEAASATSIRCQQSWSDFRDLDVPSSFSDEAEKVADEAHSVCADAYFAKRQFAEEAKEIADGNMKPSQMQEAKQYAEASSAGVLACVAKSLAAASEAGADIEDLTKDSE